MPARAENLGTAPARSRRRFLAAAAGLVAVLGTGGSPAGAGARLRAALDKILDGRAAATGKVSLDLAPITENGASVLVGVQVDSPMTQADHVLRLHLLAEENPNVTVVTFHFTPQAGKVDIITRIRLAKSQNVHAVAETSGGEVYVASKFTKVTIGGCGGGN
ncbi:MAG: thiosulfate oxidation carrier protein SoxY [Hyphomicrobiales bacterium]|nr:thiosulfate oxidation carrier protein SoxY [Hyphomicrobiales bacterium]MCP5372819.1 thiosulfate oxidation carrier protein SoxY [Hyphomicrobiales bacterium]